MTRFYSCHKTDKKNLRGFGGRFLKIADVCTKIYNARAQPLFCSLSLLFGDVPVAVAVMVCLITQRSLRSWQTRTHCCGHIVADTNVSPFARARNICCGHQFCVRDTKNVSDFVQKHFVCNKCFPVCAAQETSWATMCPQQCVLVCQGL